MLGANSTLEHGHDDVGEQQMEVSLSDSSQLPLLRQIYDGSGRNDLEES